MSWNVTRFNIGELSVGSNYLWTPDVILVNSADGKYSRNREHYALILRHDGSFDSVLGGRETSILILVGQHFQATCDSCSKIYGRRFVKFGRPISRSTNSIA